MTLSRVFIAFGALVASTLVSRVPTAWATVSPRCSAVTCSFTFPSVRDCETVPANHRLYLDAGCTNSLEALPRVETADGAPIPGEWRRANGDGTLGNFEFSGALPEGVEVNVRGVVPESCQIASVGPSLSQWMCADEDAGILDCCALYEAAGLSFFDEGEPTDDSSGGSAGGGGEGGGSGNDFLYLRFFTGAPDVEPPAAPSLRVTCGSVGADQYLVRVELVGDFDDVRELSVSAPSWSAWGGGSHRAFAPRCVGPGTRRFETAHFFDYIDRGTLSFTPSATDWSDSTTTGETVTITVPDDCSGLVDSEGTLHECDDSDFVVDASCQAHPSSVVEADVCGMLPPEEPTPEPPFVLPPSDGQSPVSEPGEPPPLDGTSEVDGCSCRAAGADQRSISSWLASGCALLVALVAVRRRRRTTPACVRMNVMD